MTPAVANGYRAPTSNQMPRLTLGQVGSGLSQRDNLLLGQKCFQETGFVVASAATVIAPQDFGHGLRVEMEFGGEKFKEEFHQPCQGDAVGAVRARVQPVAEAEESGKRP